MKSILLASVSAFAFAGAAAADVAWSGSASASYNSIEGVTTDADLRASASVAGNWTLSATLSAFDSAPKISATDGTSTLTFGNNHALGAAGLDQARQDLINDAVDAAKSADISVSTTMGGVGLSLSMSQGGNTEIGVTTSAGGADVSAGFVVDGTNQGDYRLGLSTSAGGAELSFSTTSLAGDTDYDISATMAVSGVEVTVAIDEAQAWSVSGSYTMGDLTVSAGTTSAAGNDYTLGVDYAMGDIAVGFTTDEDSEWTASVAYTSGAITAGVSMAHDEDADITVSYDIGGGAVISAGLVSDVTYAALAYDLGSGAELTASYASADHKDADGEEVYAKGTTVGVSFSF
jgi:outer membrane protein OmpU